MVLDGLESGRACGSPVPGSVLGSAPSPLYAEPGMSPLSAAQSPAAVSPLCHYPQTAHSADSVCVDVCVCAVTSHLCVCVCCCACGLSNLKVLRCRQTSTAPQNQQDRLRRFQAFKPKQTTLQISCALQFSNDITDIKCRYGCEIVHQQVDDFSCVL